MSKYGRPPLGKGKRNIKIQISMSNAEFKQLQKRFGEENISPKLRKFILNTEDQNHKNDDESYQADQNIVYELKKIGNSLNQIAFKIDIDELEVNDKVSNHLRDLQAIIGGKLS